MLALAPRHEVGVLARMRATCVQSGLHQWHAVRLLERGPTPITEALELPCRRPGARRAVSVDWVEYTSDGNYCTTSSAPTTMRAAGQSSYNSAACTAGHWLRGVVIIIAAGFLLSCSSPLANLPDAAKLPDRTLNNNQHNKPRSTNWPIKRRPTQAK